MSEMHGPGAALPLLTAGIGLAAFICGFGSGARRAGNVREIALLIGLAGAVIFIAGLAAMKTGAPSDV
ncbi:MAG: hypothetical protein OXF88_20640 [Rhodobacteraceae bacterium]|nr:hypothetical protein [Paracoccaceae bacterium]